MKFKDIKKIIEERANKPSIKPKKGNKKVSRKRVFVSFDYENDRRYKFMLEAWDAHPNLDFCFFDWSSQEINSDNIARIKAGLSTKINQATQTLVIVGKEANKLHKDREKIGYRNWLNFEIAKSKDAGNKLIGVKLDRSYEPPVELLGANAKWAMSFIQSSIVRAVNES
jgi:hypothetical protein